MTPDLQKRLACREASSMEELVMLLKLRHSAAFDLDDGCEETGDDSGFHLDAYDLKAWHLGLFMETEEWSKPIGYLRVVENGGITDWRVRQLAAQQDDAVAVAGDDPAPLPILDDWPDLPALRRSYDRHAGLDGRVVEATWLKLAPGCRSLGLDVFLIESAIAAFFFALCVDAAFMTTSAMQQDRFERIGFAVAEGTRAARIGSPGRWVVCLVATPDRVKPLLHPSILKQSCHFRAAEHITMDLKQWIASAPATRDYMSPEQTEMTGRDIDTRTDV